MRICFQDESLVVIDQFLSPANFARVSSGFATEPFKLVHVPERQPVFRPGDGMPFDGSAVVRFSPTFREALPAEDQRDELAFYVHPSGRSIDVLLERVCAVASQFEDVLGREGREWVALHGKPWLYPTGAGLGWHDDGKFYSAAFTYYAHPRWNPDWGGELLVSSDRSLKFAQAPSPFGNEREQLAILREGFGRYVLPKPNRLVLLKGGTPHRVSPVTMSAGDAYRASVAGFFLRAQGAKNMLAARG